MGAPSLPCTLPPICWSVGAASRGAAPYLLTYGACPRERAAWAAAAAAAGLPRPHPIPAAAAKDVSLVRPPLPLGVPIGGSKAHRAGLRLSLALSAAHAAAWAHASAHVPGGRVLVAEDTLWLRPRAIRGLAGVLNDVDEAAVAGGGVWHLLYLRRERVGGGGGATTGGAAAAAAAVANPGLDAEEVWAPAASGAGGVTVTRARPSAGAGLYVRSGEGVAWLAAHFGPYVAPVGEQLGRLQRGTTPPLPAASPPQGGGARNRGAGVLVAAAVAVAAAPIPPALVALAACAAPADGRLCGELVTEMPTLDECPEGGGRQLRVPLAADGRGRRRCRHGG